MGSLGQTQAWLILAVRGKANPCLRKTTQEGPGELGLSCPRAHDEFMAGSRVAALTLLLEALLLRCTKPTLGLAALGFG